MNSFSILRTNVGLTTNLKIMIDSNLKMSLDSINSVYNLDIDSLKNIKFNKSNYYDELIPYFWKDIASELVYYIKNDDVVSMSNDYQYQYDELYQYGARNISNNKDYVEEFEYFAPLYINKTLPENFIVFRHDGLSFGNLNKDNFIDITNNFKVVKNFNLRNSDVGEWLNNNFTNNTYIPISPLDIDFRNLEFSHWNGIDLETGGYTTKSIFIDDFVNSEKEIFEFDKWVLDNYKFNKLVFPNILNLSFLFDDEPSTPEYKRKWSINKYYGFYIDEMSKISNISPYLYRELKSDTTIVSGNILEHTSNEPFKDKWSDLIDFYVEYEGLYYRVIKTTQTLYNQSVVTDTNGLLTDVSSDVIKTIYKIQSPIDLTDKQLYVNKNYALIINNELLDKNLQPLVIPNFDSECVYIININNIEHSLILDGNTIKINSDYLYNYDTISNKLRYKVAGVNNTIDIDKPLVFDIFKLKFTDIKDFDTKIVDTDYSKYEYEKVDEITYTDESKMYLDNIENDNLDDFIYKNEIVNIPVSSEYISNLELFKIDNNNLSDIWNVNPKYCRWGYKNSISANDKPYLLNNSLQFEDFNRTSNSFSSDPIRYERNLDYFYSINPDSNNYSHHSLHINKDVNFNFELSKYLTNSSDYFLDVFGATESIGGVIKNTQKYSYFNLTDGVKFSDTLLRGVKFEIASINGIYDGKTINTEPTKEFEDYKFSILLTNHNDFIDNKGGLSQSNIPEWDIIEEWSPNLDYGTYSYVMYDHIVYTNNNDLKYKCSIDSSPTKEEWSIYNTSSNVFYNDSSNDAGYFYYYTDYFYMNVPYSEWKIWKKGYKYSNINGEVIVLYKNKYYKYVDNINTSEYDINTWLEVDDPGYFTKIGLYNGSKIGYYIIDDILYKDGVRKHSFKYDAGIVDSITKMNDHFYIRRDIGPLNNSINIYINKIYKNILIDLNIGDNTYSDNLIRNCNRDLLYNNKFGKLTLSSFIESINNTNNKNGWSDYVNYYIIENIEGVVKVSKYNAYRDIAKLPYILSCTPPDELKIKANSLIKNRTDDALKADNILKNGKINDISELNYYNDIPIAYTIEDNLNENIVVDNYHSNLNIINNSIYRFSGPYEPIFVDIELFKDSNYKFNTKLSEFGLIKEMKFKKINKKGNILKLKDYNDRLSIYPMLDEFGITWSDHFIFKSTSDLEYHKESSKR